MRVALPVVLFCMVLSIDAVAKDRSQCPTGMASVIDGDTIEIHGERIRLFGIDAPESSQSCGAGNQVHRCGQRAALALADLTQRRRVDCECRGTDRYRRHVATCRLSGLDLAAWLVREGYAVAMRRYSTRYVPEEDAARAQHKGVWAGPFEMPWDWRARRRRAP